MSTESETFIVFGAAGGIGSAVARELNSQNANVLLVGQTESKLKNLSDDLDQPYEILDARDPEAIVELVQATHKNHGSLSGMVNCVGSMLLKPAHLTSQEEWDMTLQTNLTSSFGVVKAAGKAMKRDGGSVVLMSSAAARVGLVNHEAIAAAKGGIIGLTLSAAATYAPRNLRFNAVAPGLVETPLTTPITSSEIATKASAAMHPLKRFGKPDQIASLICWLLKSENDWVTGQVFGIDGGLGTVQPKLS